MTIALRPFGSAGQKVTVVGQGTWKMERDDRDTAVAALRHGLDLGLTHVDTAEIYGSGRVEQQYVSKVIAGRRDEVFLVSKVAADNASYDGTLKACEDSLKRLGTGHLDCYLLHWPGPHPLEQTIAAFEKLVADGKIRSWGVSNFDVPELDEALRIAGKGRIACNQVLYHLGAREVEHGVLPWCRQHGVTLVGYSPFGSGRFPAPTSAGGKVLATVAARHETTPHAVAIAFLTRDPHTVTIPKASTASHVEANRKAADLVLTEADVREVAAAFPVRAGGELHSV